MEKKKTTKESVKKSLREQLSDAASEYVKAMHRLWDLDVTGDDYWIAGAGHPCSAPYQLRSLLFLSLDDIQYIIEHDLSFDHVSAWQDYLTQTAAIGIDASRTTLREYTEHSDRMLKPEALERLRMLREDFDTAIEEELAKTRKKY